MASPSSYASLLLALLFLSENGPLLASSGFHSPIGQQPSDPGQTDPSAKQLAGQTGQTGVQKSQPGNGIGQASGSSGHSTLAVEQAMLIDLENALKATSAKLETVLSSISFATLNATQLNTIDALALVDGLESVLTSYDSEEGDVGTKLNTLNVVQSTLSTLNQVMTYMLQLNLILQQVAAARGSVITLEEEIARNARSNAGV